MTTPLIFLDFDGVLTTVATGYRHRDARCVAQLNRILAATGAKIVVSSTWRGAPDLKDILKSWGVTGEVVDITPDLRHRRESGIEVAATRGAEIAQWILRNDPAGPFVILDDDDDMGDLRLYHIRTNSRLGLSEADAERAISVLLSVKAQLLALPGSDPKDTETVESEAD